MVPNSSWELILVDLLQANLQYAPSVCVESLGLILKDLAYMVAGISCMELDTAQKNKLIEHQPNQ